MEALSLILTVIAAIIAVIYGVTLIIKAFQVSVWWGLGYMFVPFVALIFIVMHWQVAKEPFVKSLIAIPLMILGIALAPESAFTH